MNAPTGPALTALLPVLKTDVVAAPAVSVAQGVVFGFATVGSVTRAFSNVIRVVLARQPNGVVVAAVAEPAAIRATSPTLRTAASRRVALLIQPLLDWVLLRPSLGGQGT